MNKIAETCRVLSNTSRLTILQYIEKSGKSFEEIRSMLNANNNTITFHLKKLYDANMIVKNNDKHCINQYGKMALRFWRKFEKLVETGDKEVKK